MAIDIRAITESELEAYINASARGFGGDILEGEADRVGKVIGVDRCHAPFAEGRMVGTVGSYGFPMALPGEVDIQSAGLTRVTVAATHRRKGLLTGMMNTHFEDAIEHGESISTLWASEALIYGRFGYGQATENLSVAFDSRLTDITRPAEPDDMSFVSADEVEKFLPEIYERFRIKRPGIFGRSELWWTHRCIPDPEAMRRGLSSRRTITASRDGQLVGYASFRQKDDWGDDDMPSGEIKVVEVAALDRQAEHSLWWQLSNIDLFPKVSSWSQPADTLLPWFATNSRAVSRHFSDGIYVRVLDVEKTFSTRRYQLPTDLVFSVTDDRLPELAGTYRLTAGDDGIGTCVRTDAQPDFVIDIRALGAMCLGYTRPEPLAAIGQIQATGATAGREPNAAELQRLRDAFGWPLAAWCPEMF